jgi:hypothetical protein
MLLDIAGILLLTEVLVAAKPGREPRERLLADAIPEGDQGLAVAVASHHGHRETRRDRLPEGGLAGGRHKPAAQVEPGRQFVGLVERTTTGAVGDRLALERDRHHIPRMIDDAAVELVRLARVREDNREWRLGRVEAEGAEPAKVRLRRGQGVVPREHPGVTPHHLPPANLPVDQRNLCGLAEAEHAPRTDPRTPRGHHHRPAGERAFDVFRGRMLLAAGSAAVETAVLADRGDPVGQGEELWCRHGRLP